MPDYINYICPQFSETQVNFQRVPIVDTSNPFTARHIPSQDESMLVIRFRDPRGVDFPYLLSMLKESFMSRGQHHRLPWRQDAARHAADLHPDDLAIDGTPASGGRVPRRPARGARQLRERLVAVGRFELQWEEIDMAALWLLSVEAAIEGATGLALIIFPQAVASLLLGAVLAAAGIVVARVAGIALLSLGLVCWMSRQDASKTAALAAMLNYNLLVTAYLMYLGLGGVLVGMLLWPAIAIHAVLTVLVASTWFKARQPKPEGTG